MVELLIKDKGIIKIENFPIALTYSVSDIRNPNIRTGSSSKTIQIPGTPETNKLFSDLYNTNVTDGSFDLGGKYECIVLQNGHNIFEGYILLKDIVHNPTSSIYFNDSEIVYNVVLYNKAVDFFTSIDDKNLTDIDFNLSGHQLTTDSITATYYNTYLDTYKYFLLYNQSGREYQPTDFWPAIFTKQYVDRIISDAGFSQDSDSFFADDFFKKTVVPFQGNINMKDPTLWNKELFYGAQTATTTYLGVSTTTYSVGGNIPFEDYYNYPYFQNDYSQPVGNTYIPSTGGAQKFTLKVTGNITYKSPVDAWYGDYNGYNILYLIANPLERNRLRPFNFYLKINGVNSASHVVTTYNCRLPANDYVDLGKPDIIGGKSIVQNFEFTTDFPEAVFLSGDQITMDLFLKAFGNGKYFNNSGTTVGTTVNFTTNSEVAVATTLQITNLSWNNVPAGTTTRNVNDTIIINDYIPKNVKQKQFFGDICRAFNLIVDADEGNKLTIKNRDDYYSTPTKKNWSSLIDKTKEQTIQYLPELQKKEYVLKYKDGQNQFSKQYKDFYNESYGNQKIVYDSEIIIGSENKELMFSDCPTIDAFGLLVPAIPVQSHKDLHLLFDAGLINSTYTINENNNITYLDSYPCLSHWDNINTPTQDLNYGFCRAYFKNGPYTQNNLYNIYHYNTFKQISEQIMYTAYFWLTELEMSNLKLSDKITVDEQEYIINKIENYNPTSNNSTKVELIKWYRVYENQPTRRKPVYGGEIIEEGPTVPVKPIVINPAIPVGIINDVTVNQIKPGSTLTYIFGRGNKIETGHNNMIIGDNNVLWSNINNTVLMNATNIAVGGTKEIPFTGVTNQKTTIINSDDLVLSTSTTNNVFMGVTQEEVDNADDNTFVVGENIQMIYHGDTIEEYVTNVIVSGTTLSGNSYVFVPAKEDYAHNGVELLNAYSEARLRVRRGTVPNCTVLLAPGLYMLPSQLVMNTNNVYLCGLSTKQNTIISGNTIFINNNILTYLENIWNPLTSGINFHQMNAITTIKNCDSGIKSFGYQDLPGTAYTIDVSGTFIDCTAGNNSFGYYGAASGNFYNCKSGDYSFGACSTGTGQTGYFSHCIGNVNCFGSNTGFSGTTEYCVAGANSYGGTGRTGTVLYSRLTSGTFSTTPSATGKVRLSLDGSLSEINLN